MNGVIMMVIAIVVLGGGYLFYGRYLEKKWGIDPNAKTPAYEQDRSMDRSRQQSLDGFRCFYGF